MGEQIPPAHSTPAAFDDADYPAYTTGRAAEMLGVQPAFLRSLDAAGLLNPERSRGGHRRYSRRELTLAARVRELLDSGLTLLPAACRIAWLEQELHRTQAGGSPRACSSSPGGQRRPSSRPTKRRAQPR
jgi:hypothetical protein